jgi:hypothetical protein
MLIACIRERAKRLQLPANLPVPRDRETLAQAGSFFRREVRPRGKRSRSYCSIPAGGRLDRRYDFTQGSAANFAFAGLLWRDLLVSLLLGVAERPNLRASAGLARDAAAAFLQVHPPAR